MLCGREKSDPAGSFRGADSLFHHLGHAELIVRDGRRILQSGGLGEACGGDEILPHDVENGPGMGGRRRSR